MPLYLARPLKMSEAGPQLRAQLANRQFFDLDFVLQQRVELILRGRHIKARPLVFARRPRHVIDLADELVGVSAPHGALGGRQIGQTRRPHKARKTRGKRGSRQRKPAAEQE